MNASIVIVILIIQYLCCLRPMFDLVIYYVDSVIEGKLTRINIFKFPFNATVPVAVLISLGS